MSALINFLFGPSTTIEELKKNVKAHPEYYNYADGKEIEKTKLKDYPNGIYLIRETSKAAHDFVITNVFNGKLLSNYLDVKTEGFSINFVDHNTTEKNLEDLLNLSKYKELRFRMGYSLQRRWKIIDYRNQIKKNKAFKEHGTNFDAKLALKNQPRGTFIILGNDDNQNLFNVFITINDSVVAEIKMTIIDAYNVQFVEQASFKKATLAFKTFKTFVNEYSLPGGIKLVPYSGDLTPGKTEYGPPEILS